MEIKIVKEKENPFFKRKDLVIDVIHTSGPTPKTGEVAKELAAKYNVDESQVVIDYILTKKGLSESSVKAKILNEKPIEIEKKETKEEVKEETQPEEKQEEQEEVKEDDGGEKSNN